MVGSSFYISISPVPAVQHGGFKFLYQYQYQPSSMVGSSFYISISTVQVQHGGVKFLYQSQSSSLAVFILLSVQYQPSSMVGSSFYISISPVPAVQHGGVKFYISISPVPAVQHGGVKFLYQYQSSTSRLAWWGPVFISVSVSISVFYQYQSSTSRLAWWGQVFISVSVEYQPSSMVGSSFYISISPVPAVQHGGVKFLYQYQSSTSRLAWWGQVFISVSVQYQPSSMVGQYQSSTSRLAWWGQVFISLSVQYQPSSIVGSSFYISISPVPPVLHGGVQFLYQYQYCTSLAWWGQVFISVSVAWWGSFYITIQNQPSSMVGSSFYISISPVPTVQHGGVKFLYQSQSITSRLAWWGQVFISLSVQYQPSSMVGSSFYISISPVPAVQHGGVKFLYQYQSSTSRLAWWGPVFISVSVQ